MTHTPNSVRCNDVTRIQAYVYELAHKPRGIARRNIHLLGIIVFAIFKVQSSNVGHLFFLDGQLPLTEFLLMGCGPLPVQSPHESFAIRSFKAIGS